MITEVVLEAMNHTSVWSWISTLSSILYIVGASRGKVWCWPVGIVGSAAAIVEYYYQQLPAESVLNGIYVILGFSGWYMWLKQKQTSKNIFTVKTCTASQLQLVLFISLVGGFTLGFISTTYNWSNYPYIDSVLAGSSVAATWLTTKRYIENWIFWIIIDGASVVLYIHKGPEMYLFAILFFIFTVLSIRGLISWKRQLSNA
jgi:nicotinamide mononucleotide transporter